MTTTIEEVLRLDAQQAYSALGGVATAAEQAAFSTRQASVAALGLSDAEAVAAASVRSASEAETLRAQVLGVSVIQLRQMQAALAAKREEDERAATATRALATAHKAQSSALAATIADTEIYAKGTIGAGLAATQASIRTGQQAASIKNLGAQIADIGKGLASGVSPFTILVQQGDQVVGALSGIIPAGANVGTMLAGLAVPMGIVAAGLAGLVALVDDYARAGKAAKAATDAFKSALLPIGDAIKAAKQEQELLNKAVESGNAKSYLTVADISKGVDEQEAEATKGLRAERDLLMQQLADSSNMENFAGQTAQKRIATINEEIGVIHQKANELAGLAVQNATIRKSIEAETGSVKSNSDGKKLLAADERDLTAALKEQATAREFLLKIGASGSASSVENDAYRSTQAAILAAGEKLKDPTLVQGALDAAYDQHAAKMVAIMAKERADMLAGLEEDTAAAYNYDTGLGTSAPVVAPVVAETGMTLAGGLSAAGGGISTLTTALGAAGPYGAAVAAGISLVNGIHDGLLTSVADFASTLADNMKTIGKDIAPFIKAVLLDVLPSLASAIPGIISSVATEVPKALFQVIRNPDFWKGLVQAMFDILMGWKIELVRGVVQALKDFVRILVSPDVWVNIGRGIVDAVRDGFRGLFGLSPEDSAPGSSRRLGSGLGDLMSGQATFSLFHRTNGEQRVGGGVVLGRLGDIAENIKRGVQGRNIGWGNG